MKKYSLKNDVLWYKKGTTFWFDDNAFLGKTLYIDDHISEPIATLDNLQNAIASHFEDDDVEDYFEVLDE